MPIAPSLINRIIALRVAESLLKLDSHTLALDESYPDGCQSHDDVPAQTRDQFHRSGIPPQDYVVVTWAMSTVPTIPRHLLIHQSKLDVVDRELLIGDVVKRGPSDAMSGTVIDCQIKTDLAPPVPFHSSRDQSPFRLGHPLLDVSARDLVQPVPYTVGQMVMYQGWVGKIRDVFEKISLWLSNESVVTLEDVEDITEAPLHPDDAIHVGDFIKTKKGNLRRGQWIYGVFDPNVEPQGYVASVSPMSIHVDWIAQKYGVPDIDTPPHFEVEREVLESGSLLVYDMPERSPEDASDQPSQRRDLLVGINDKVRFRDLPAAAARYNSSGKGQGRLESISRQDAGGFDINVFTVTQTRSQITVLWQDLSTTTCSSVDCIPSLDLDDDDEVWPGELITTRKALDETSSTYTPSRVGIVQSVNSRERVAQIRWFSGSVAFANDDHHILLPDSLTGTLLPGVEQVSLYEIWTRPGLSRRLGDFVIFLPPPATPPSAAYAGKTEMAYQEAQRLSEPLGNEREWLGEVAELGLDGLLTVRLGASPNPRNVKIPWECTLMAYGTDYDDTDMDADDGLVDLDGSSENSSTEASEDGVWVDEMGHDIDQGDDEEAQWMTDEEENNAMEVDDDDNTPLEDEKGSTHGPNPGGPLQFSYSNFFSRARESSIKLASFEILDGSAPQDHHFSMRDSTSMDTHRLRRIQKEQRILQSSMPEGVWVRTWESSLDLMRVLILGPMETPYELAPFVFDLHLPPAFPTVAPKVFFHSWTNNEGPVNPNLYEDGKVCLSLLGTWPGDTKNESWSPKSTILQILVSLLGLVLVKEPFYNEAGYEIRSGFEETRVPSALYSERTYLRCHEFIRRGICQSVGGMDDIIHKLYVSQQAGCPLLAIRAVWQAIMTRRKSEEGETADKAEISDYKQLQHRPRQVSRGALLILNRHINALIDVIESEDSESAQTLRRMQEEGACVGSGGPLGIFDELRDQGLPN